MNCELGACFPGRFASCLLLVSTWFLEIITAADQKISTHGHSSAMTAAAKARHAYFVLVRLFVHEFVLGVVAIVLSLRLYLLALSPGCRQSVFNKNIFAPTWHTA